MPQVQPYLIALLILCQSVAYAQFQRIGSPSINNFSRSEYQAGTQNWAIAQEENGIIYFGNNKGLLEFDGTNWQVFALPNRTIVRSFTFDQRGRLYLGGQNEMGYMEPDEQGKRTYTSLNPLLPKELQSFEDIWDIFIQDQGIYFCSQKAIFLLQNGKIKVIRPRSGRFENFFELGDKIYLQDKQFGLFELIEDQLHPVPGGDRFGDQRIVALLPHNQQNALLFTVSEGLFLMSPTGISSWLTASSDFLTSYLAYCAIELTDGSYAIGTSQNGMLLMDRQGVPIMHLNQNKGLQNNTVLSICQDKQQNLWLGLDNGIDYAEINSPFSIIHSEMGIEGTGYASRIHDGNLYLGTNQGLFYTDWQNNNDPLNLPQFKPVPNTLGQVWNINSLGNRLVLGQHKGAAYIANANAQSFSTIQGAWKFMALESRPNYAIEGTYTGLVLYENLNRDPDPEAKADWTLVRKLEGFNESVRVFEEDEAGNIWVSHPYKGLFKIELSADLQSIKNIRFYNAQQGLPSDPFINVTKIRNELIFTTPHGVFRYEKENDHFVKHEDFNKILGEDRNVHRLLEDKMGNIWFSVDADFGVLRIKEKGVFNQLEVEYFNHLQEDLVDGFEHVYVYDKDNVFIGTEKGFVHYNPSLHKKNDFPFRTLLRKVTSITHSDSVVYGGNLGGLESPKALTFPDKMNDFRFAFSAPYYEKPNHLQYQFMLEGFEDTWSEWTPKTEKEYTNLIAGNYQFKVQARNAYGEVSAPEIFSFRVLPPWYSNVYAKSAYFVLAIFSLFGLIRYISRREKKKTEAFKLEQTQKLERKEAEFKEEVKKSEGEIIKLRNEKLQTDIKHKNSQLASATMHLVQKSEIMMKIKSDLQNLLADAPKEFKKKVEQISKTIEADIRLDNNWEQFEQHFDQVHEDFFKRLRQRFPDLTPKDQKLSAYLRMNLSTKEIAPLLNISVRGVEISRYRLRKKLQLDQEVNLVAFIMDI